MAKILKIEDVEEARASLRRMLERKGNEVFDAPNGKIGIDIIEKEKPDVVITDIFMPEMEGLETIQKIANSKPELPIIAISGYPQPSFLEAALKFGAVYGLNKPFGQDELLAALRQVLNNAEK